MLAFSLQKNRFLLLSISLWKIGWRWAILWSWLASNGFDAICNTALCIVSALGNHKKHYSKYTLIPLVHAIHFDVFYTIPHMLCLICLSMAFGAIFSFTALIFSPNANKQHKCGVCEIPHTNTQ